MEKETTYWIALAHLPNWGYSKINNTIIRFFHEEKISVEEFFNLPESIWSSKYQLTGKEILDLQNATTELPNNAFFAENLLSQGYELIPIISKFYSKTLKNNLKATHSPPLLYVKGNKQLLDEKSVAIVGSRAAQGISLEFTDNLARVASKGFKVVISGFAKGIDKQALDSAIRYKGQSIIVLPQGITTFGTGYKTYYKQIVDGDVLVLSTFHPKADWSAGLAMARNSVIYGLAEEIFVAESSDKGGTWSGVIDGLRKGRIIYVRLPEPKEQNANQLLIEKGAIPVDFNGVEIHDIDIEQRRTNLIVNNPNINIDDRIAKVFNGKPLSSKEILEKTKLDWTSKRLTTYLQKMESIQIIKKGRSNQYLLKGSQQELQTTLFG
jgi:DNA processing protein